MKKINNIKANGSYPTSAEINRINTKYALTVRESEQEVIVFCSNDYLGMSQHPKVINAMKEVIEVYKVSTTHILPVIIGNAKKCTKAGNYLLNNFHIYVQPTNSPTVDEGTERFRINVTPNHTKEQMDFLVNALEITFNILDIPLLEIERDKI